MSSVTTAVKDLRQISKYARSP